MSSLGPRRHGGGRGRPRPVRSYVPRGQLGEQPPTVKRLMDVVVASLSLMLLAPVLLTICLAVRITLGRSVLFRQARPGYKAKPFVLYKFRTMREACINLDGTPLPDAKRLTRLGRLLRGTAASMNCPNSGTFSAGT